MQDTFISFRNVTDVFLNVVVASSVVAYYQKYVAQQLLGLNNLFFPLNTLKYFMNL